MAIERRLTEIVGPGRRQAPHRALAQRPGGHRRGDVRARATPEREGAAPRADGHARGPGRAAPRLAAAGLHPPPARPARLPLAPPAGVLLEVPARPPALQLLPHRHRRPAARRGRAGRRELRHRAGWSWPRSSASRGSPRTRSTRSRTATSCSTTSAPRPPARRTCRSSAARSCSGRARSSASARWRTRSPRARASCRRRRTRTPPSCCAPRRRGSWASWCTLHGVLHGLPLTYNKDLQEDKEPLFDAVDTVELVLRVAREMLGGIGSTASAWRRPPATSSSPPPTWPTLLVRQGVPFREAHGIVGGLVRTAVDQGKQLSELTDAEVAELGAAARRRVPRAARARGLARVEGLGGRHVARARARTARPGAARARRGRALEARRARSTRAPSTRSPATWSAASCATRDGRADRRDRELPPRSRPATPSWPHAAHADAVRPARAAPTSTARTASTRC